MTTAPGVLMVSVCRSVLPCALVPKKGLRSNTVPADFYKTLRPGDLAACHLPDPARDRAGRPVSKPVGW